MDGAGNIGASTGTFTFKIVSDLTRPGAPTLRNPESGETAESSRPTFRWSQITDLSGVTYTIEIGRGDQPLTGEFSQPVFRQIGIPDDPIVSGDELVIEFKRQRQLPGGTLFWHVRAVDGSGNVGNFSDEVREFAVIRAAGDLTMESFLSELGTADYAPTFRWRVAPGAESYEVSVDNRPFRDIGSGDLIEDTTPPEAPNLLSPRDGSTGSDTTPTFTWTRGNDPSRLTYTLEIDFAGGTPLTGDFKVPFAFGPVEIPEPASTGDVRFDLLQALATGAYIWRVRAQDKVGTSSFSRPFSFTILPDTDEPARPTLISPRDGSTGSNTTPTFTWTQVTKDINGRTDRSGVTSYTLEIATGDQPPTGDFNNPILRKVSILDETVTGDRIQFTLSTSDALATGDYIWHVVAVDGAGNTGEYSDRITFTVDSDAPTPPLVPTLISPATGDTKEDTTPTFTWSQVTGDLSPVTYTLEIDFAAGDPLTGDFIELAFGPAEIPEPVSTGDVSFDLPEGNALAVGAYIWRVRAENGKDNTGDFSDPFIFTVLPDSDEPARPTTISPRTGSTGSNTTPTFTWTQVTKDINGREDRSGVETYILEIATGDQPPTGDFNNPVLREVSIPDESVSGDRIQFTLATSDALATGDYIWHV